jgi:hypothetical protein
LRRAAEGGDQQGTQNLVYVLRHQGKHLAARTIVKNARKRGMEIDMS